MTPITSSPVLAGLIRRLDLTDEELAAVGSRSSGAAGALTQRRHPASQPVAVCRQRPNQLLVRKWRWISEWQPSPKAPHQLLGIEKNLALGRRVLSLFVLPPEASAA